MPGQTHFNSRLVENLGATPLVAADFVPSAGFGSTATATPVAGSTDSRGAVDILSQGSGIGANPTVVLTFKDGAFTNPDGSTRVPFVACARGDNASGAGYWAPTTITATAVTFTYVGTPVTANTYRLNYIVKP